MDALPDKDKKKKQAALERDIATLQTKIAAIERLTAEIGGVITEAEAKTLILRKHHDLVAEQLDRYLNAEKRALIQFLENLWDKYAVAAQRLETEGGATVSELKGFLQKLAYIESLR